MRWMLDTDTCIAIIKQNPLALKKLRGKSIGQVGIHPSRWDSWRSAPRKAVGRGTRMRRSTSFWWRWKLQVSMTVPP